MNDILDLSRMKSGTMDFRFSSYNLTFIMQLVYDSQKVEHAAGEWNCAPTFRKGTGKSMITVPYV